MTNESAANDLKLALLFGDVPPSHFSILPLLEDQSVTGFFIHKADGVYEMKFTTPEARQNFLVKGSLTVGNRSLPIKTWPFIATERYRVLDVGLDVAEEDVQKAFEKGMVDAVSLECYKELPGCRNGHATIRIPKKMVDKIPSQVTVRGTVCTVIRPTPTSLKNQSNQNNPSHSDQSTSSKIPQPEAARWKGKETVRDAPKQDSIHGPQKPPPQTQKAAPQIASQPATVQPATTQPASAKPVSTQPASAKPVST